MDLKIITIIMMFIIIMSLIHMMIMKQEKIKLSIIIYLNLEIWIIHIIIILM